MSKIRGKSMRHKTAHVFTLIGHSGTSAASVVAEEPKVELGQLTNQPLIMELVWESLEKNKPATIIPVVSIEPIKLWPFLGKRM